MEQRAFQRIAVSIESDLISSDTSFLVVIKNISENGLCLNIISSHIKTSIHFSPETKIRLKFQLPSGEMLYLDCRVIWSYQISTPVVIKKVGVEIINPTSKYREFIKTLS
jgi:hypothetical protein